jgi:hypothetical protein
MQAAEHFVNIHTKTDETLPNISVMSPNNKERKYVVKEKPIFARRR